VRDRTYCTSGPLATDTTKCEVGGGGGSIACGVLIAAPRAELHDALDTDSQGLKLLTDDALWHLSAEIFHQQTYTAILWERESVNGHTLAPAKGSEGTERWL
jgi:hypothetical protein